MKRNENAAEAATPTAPGSPKAPDGALKDLIAEFQRDLYKPEREHLRRTELEAMQMYNRIRHEAAQEIRYAGGFRLAFSEHLRGMAAAADLIDPWIDHG